MEKLRAGWIGLGKMGLPMAARVAAAGYPLTVYNRTPGKSGSLKEKGARVADSPRSVAENADVTFTMISDDAALEEVALGKKGALSGAGKGHILIDMSTVSPASSLKVAAEAAKKNVGYLRAPVSGSTKFAETGSLTFFVSGPEPLFKKFTPLLEAMGQKLFYLGPNEEARYLKLLVNMMVGTTAMMMAEALTFGEKSGIEWRRMIEAVQQSVVASPLVGYKAGTLIERNFTPAFTASQIAKDFDTALAAGKELNVPMPVTALVRQYYAGMKATGRSDLDYFGLVLYFEELAGIGKK